MKAATMTDNLEEETKLIPKEQSKAVPEDKLPKAGALQDDELELATGGVRANGPIMN
jgi:hypothetical protein